VPRPARALAVTAALIVAGGLVGGTAYAASQAQSPDETLGDEAAAARLGEAADAAASRPPL
jgi:hypothetical protein